ncbi:UDP-glycosyltransferase 83A1-like [Pistacia vera]|uniref:UDP-glycosyltransferase 83A1-like n=1 Tax=Pistacia vera TaxID=55513 RepID=UPI001262FEB4|nr:UDP-glycosyltransferase 83A1-like [Pistacia vera]
MTRPHILVIPFPAQGHVISLLELSHCLVKHGLRVTFANTDHTHKRVINALQEKNYVGDDEEIRLVSIPDGLEPWEDRNDLGKLCESLVRVMPGKRKAIQEINNKEEDEKIIVGVSGLYYHIPKLIDDGIINKDGTTTGETYDSAGAKHSYNQQCKFIWNVGDLITQRKIFLLIEKGSEGIQMEADYLICNTTDDLEPEAFNLVPKVLPIGPLLASNRQGNSEDTSGQKTQLAENGWINSNLTQSFMLHLAASQF